MCHLRKTTPLRAVQRSEARWNHDRLVQMCHYRYTLRGAAMLTQVTIRRWGLSDNLADAETESLNVARELRPCSSVGTMLDEAGGFRRLHRF